jgi:lipopolysaccharide/colanic/teichoic acid biosynthesis glycosyltransferase
MPLLPSPKLPPAPNPSRTPRRMRAASAQRAVDLVLGAILLAAALPVIAVAAALVRLSSRGPAIYTQTRLGRYGRPFVIYKIRTMEHGCERRSGARWSSGRGDPRVTPIGRLLRRTHVDELPQFWNILRGDMSLIGPRPERPEIVAALEAALPAYTERMAVRPGLTGLAQVQLPPDIDLNSVRRKLQYDLHYVAQGTLWLDLRLLAGTVFHVLGLPPTVTRAVLVIPGPVEVEAPPERSPGPVAGPHAYYPPAHYRDSTGVCP